MSVFGKLKAAFGVEDYEEYYEDEMDEQEELEEVSQPVRSATHSQRTVPESNRNIVNINATSQLKVVLLRPESYSRDANAIADHLKSRHAVLMNLERTAGGEARRLLDFLSGVAYAQEGTVKRVAEKAFLISPNTVDVENNDLIYEMDATSLA
ncbi:MAG: cell division protein SepF [Bacillota bacterium]|nr:cell division protein SepF [Bacillota bacterium]